MRFFQPLFPIVFMLLLACCSKAPEPRNHKQLQGLRLSMTIEERPDGWTERFTSHDILSTSYYEDAQGRPAAIVCSAPGMEDIVRTVSYTDSSFILQEGNSGRTEYLLKDGLVVRRRPLDGGYGCWSYSYDAARHLRSYGSTLWQWQGASIKEVDVRSMDNQNEIARYIDYDEQKALSQNAAAMLIAHQWGMPWLLPFLIKGYFGELPAQVPYKVSYDDGHWDLYRMTQDDNGKVRECHIVNEHRTIEVIRP